MPEGSYILFVYFGIAVFQAFLSGANIKLIAKDEALKAAAVTFTTNLISFTVLYSIIARLGTERGLVAITIYCLGLAAGIYLAVKAKFGVNR